jgi:hypothetical protein
MKTKHTPEPWIADECFDASGFITIRVADGTPNGDADEQPIATVYSEAHARLIAAAPELLEALKRLLDPSLKKDIREADEARARAVVAKATGG